MSMACGNCNSGMNPSQIISGMGDRFKTADTDGSEAVSKQEFVSAMEETGLDASKMEKMFSRMDSNDDGEVTQQEQQDMMSMMERRMGSLGGGGGGKGGFDSVTTLLESLQSESDNDDEKQKLQDVLDKIRSAGNGGSLMSESLSLINEIIPGINTSA